MAKYARAVFPYQTPVATPGQPLTPEMWGELSDNPTGRLVRVYRSTNSASVAAYRLRRDPQNQALAAPLQFHPVDLVAGDTPMPDSARGMFGVVTGPGRFPTALDDVDEPAVDGEAA